jgi:hypothetical protein
MRTSASKPKVLAVSKEPQRCKLEKRGNKGEQVIKFTFLGTEITSNGALQSEVQQRVHKTARISGYGMAEQISKIEN